MTVALMSRRGWRVLLLTVAIALAGAAQVIYSDARSHAHRRGNEARGQPSGEFIWIERLAGAQYPTRWGRPAQVAIAVAMGVACLVLLVVAIRSTAREAAAPHRP